MMIHPHVCQCMVMHGNVLISYMGIHDRLFPGSVVTLNHELKLKNKKRQIDSIFSKEEFALKLVSKDLLDPEKNQF